MSLREIILNTKFAADFDETIIEQNSLVLFLKEKLLGSNKPKEKWGVVKKGVEAGLIWGEEFVKNFIEFATGKNKFDDYDTIVKKIKSMEGASIQEFFGIIPKLKIKYAFLHGFSKLKELLVESGFLNGKKRELLVESGFLNEAGLINILLDTRNDESFARAFLDYSSIDNINSHLINKECKEVSNKQIYEQYGLNLIEVGNEFISYNCFFNGKIKIGKNASSIITNGDIIDKKTKAELAPKWIREKQIKRAFDKILNLYRGVSLSFLKQPKLALLGSNNPAVDYLK